MNVQEYIDNNNSHHSGITTDEILNTLHLIINDIEDMLSQYIIPFNSDDEAMTIVAKLQYITISFINQYSYRHIISVELRWIDNSPSLVYRDEQSSMNRDLVDYFHYLIDGLLSLIENYQLDFTDISIVDFLVERLIYITQIFGQNHLGLTVIFKEQHNEATGTSDVPEYTVN